MNNSNNTTSTDHPSTVVDEEHPPVPTTPQEKICAFLATKLIEMILNNRRSTTNKKNTESLVDRADKFIKANRNTLGVADFINFTSLCPQRDEYKRMTPLMAACLIKNVELVKLLIRHGAQLTLIGSSLGLELSYSMLNLKGLTAREKKSRDELINLMADLMQQNPKIHNNPRSYVFPFTCIVTEGDLNTLEKLIRRGLLDDKLRREVALEIGLKLYIKKRVNNDAIVRRLIDITPNVNQISVTNTVPLMCVDDPELFDLMIENGADVNFRNDCGNTTLMMNMSEAREPMMLKLLKAGADFSMADHEGKTALEYSKSVGSFIFMSMCHLMRVFEFFRNSSSAEIRAKCQQAVETQFTEAKNIVRIHHGSSENRVKEFRSARNRLLNYPIRYGDLYAVRRFFDCLAFLPSLLTDINARQHFYFLPYFMSTDFASKLFNDVINWNLEKNLTINGEPLSELRSRVATSGSEIEKNEVDELMRILNENRRVALYFHLNIQSHPFTMTIMNAFLPADYRKSMSSDEFEQLLEDHLSSHYNCISDLIDFSIKALANYRKLKYKL